ncbi:LAFA_0D04610g1_1 [Lachancea sp. 'fantastica']|nr:LAFA_0D04610g1_1 [Lachancea sp. 'fantastica']
MEFKQDDEDFIKELLGHAGLGDLNGNMGDSFGGSMTTTEGGGYYGNQLGMGSSFGEDIPLQDTRGERNSISHLRNVIRRSSDHGQSIDENLTHTSTQRFAQPPDYLMESLLFQHDPYQRDTLNDDQLSSFTDDVSSSFGSSVATNDFMSPRSSSFQPRESVDLASYSQFLSSSLRSPPNNLRQGTFTPSSMRNQHASQSAVGSPAVQIPHSVDSAGFAAQPLSQDERIRRRREFHKAVERRRRELIKQKVKELSQIVPPSLLNYDEKGKEVKPNKGVILARSADYLQYLQQVLEVQNRKRQLLLQKIRSLETIAQRQNHQTPSLQAGATGTSNTAAAAHIATGSSVSPEQIIDARVASYMGDNSSSTPSTTIQDDLQQFLSGDLIEAEDNAKLMFGGEGEGTAADFLLNFGK